MNLNSNISNLLAIKSQIIDLKNTLQNNPSNNIDDVLLSISTRLYDLRMQYQQTQGMLDQLNKRLFPIKNYMFYTLSNDAIHNPSFISSLITGYSAYNNTYSELAFIADLNPYYVKPIVNNNPSLSLDFTDNNQIVLDLSNYFSSVTGNALSFSFEYSSNIPRNNLKINPVFDHFLNPMPSAASLYGKFLTINPDYRNDSYDILIWAYDHFKSEHPLQITIHESHFPIISNATKSYSIWLGFYNNNKVTLQLDSRFPNSVNTLYSNDHNSPVFFDSSYYPDGIQFYIEPSTVSYVLSSNSITLIGNYQQTLDTHTLIIHPYPSQYQQRSNLYPAFDSLTLNIHQAPISFSKDFHTPTLYNSEYIIDLTAFADAYFIIDEDTSFSSSNTLLPQDLNNRLNMDSTLYLIDNNLIHLYPDYRDTSYVLSIELTHPNSLAKSNLIHLHISESNPPSPIRTDRYLILNAVIFNTTPETFSLKPYFSNPSLGSLKYVSHMTNLRTYSNILTNPYTYTQYAQLATQQTGDILNNNLYTILDDSLNITPDLRFISYDIIVYASNITYNTIDTSQYLSITVSENRPVVLDKNRIPNIKNLTNNIDFFQLDRYIYSPVGIPLEYFVSFDTSIRIDNPIPVQIVNTKTLKISGDFRNSTYNVLVTAIDPAHPKNPLQYTFSIQEELAPFPVPNSPTLSIPQPLTINTYTINLSTLFSNVPFNYRFASSRPSDAFSINNNTLIIKPNLRGISYTIPIYAINVDYNTFNINSNINISYHESYPVLMSGSKPPASIQQSKTFDLNTFFISPIYSPLSFYFTIQSNDKPFSPRNSYENTQPAVKLNKNNLTINLDYRDVSYVATVHAFDPNYSTQFACNVSFNIIEPPPLPVSLRYNSITINKETIRILDVTSYNILQYYNQQQLLYYPDYQLKIDDQTYIPNTIHIDSNVSLVFDNNKDVNSLQYPIKIDVWNASKIVSANTLFISFIDIPTVQLNGLTNIPYIYSLEYLYNRYTIQSNPFSNISLVGNSIIVSPAYRGNVGLSSSNSIILNNQYFYGSTTDYNIKIVFDDTTCLYFNVSESPPFYVSSLFYQNNSFEMAFIDNNPFTFNPINSYIKSNSTSLNIVFQQSVDNLNVRKSNYPTLANEYIDPYSIDPSTGQVTIYPDFRGITYTINVKAFLQNYPDKFVTSSYTITESQIPPIVENSNLLVFNNLLFDKDVIYLHEYFTSYVYNRFLNFTVTDNINQFTASNVYNLDVFILTLTPNARGFNYDLNIRAYDERFNNVNTNLNIKVQEGKVLNYVNNTPFKNFNINSYANIKGFLTEPYTFNISTFFTKNANYPITGKVTDAYIVDSINNTVFPKTRPRDGIFNRRVQSSSTNFDYLATIQNDTITIYPDARSYNYALEISFWLTNYPDDLWQLKGNKFIVSESNIALTETSFNDLTNVPQSINLNKYYNATTITTSDFTIINNPYNNISIQNGILYITPNCRGTVGITAGYVLYNGKYWFGSKASYNVVLQFKNSLIVDFQIKENAPFYLDLTFPGYFHYKTLTDLRPFTFDTIYPYLRSSINEFFVFEHNLQDLYSHISDSKHSVNGIKYPPFVIDSLGRLTVYPDYRNTQYVIKIKTYLRGFANNSITVNYYITETAVPLITRTNFSLTYDRLLVEPIVVDLSNYYRNYIFFQYLVYTHTNDKGLDANYYHLEGSMLIITPWARNITYVISITATDVEYNNVNTGFNIFVTESGYIEFYNDVVPSDVPILNLRDYVFTLDLSSYFVKYYPDLYIEGMITNAYIVDDGLNPILPLESPRLGFMNIATGNNPFDYIGTIDRNALILYPDYRGVTYRIEADVWLQGYSNVDWILQGISFILHENSISVFHESYSNLTNIPFTVNLRELTPYEFLDINLSLVDYRIKAPMFQDYPSAIVDSYRMILKPQSRGIQYDFWMEAFDRVSGDGIFRYLFDIQELSIPLIAVAFDILDLYNIRRIIDLQSYIDPVYIANNTVSFEIISHDIDVSYVSLEIVDSRYLHVVVDQTDSEAIFEAYIEVLSDNKQEMFTINLHTGSNNPHIINEPTYALLR